MSIGAILSGVEIRLRSSACLNDQPAEAVGKLVGVQPEGMPPPNAGQFYYAPYFAGLRNGDDNSLSMDWFYSVTVAITGRMGYAPKDRRGARMVLENQLLDRAIDLAGFLHQDELHRIRANELITGTAEQVALAGSGSVTVNGFLTPLKLASISQVRPCPPEWMHTDQKTDSYYIEVAFQNAHRIQIIGS